MAVSIEAADRIVGFVPAQDNGRRVDHLNRVDLGKVGRFVRLAYGPRLFQRRAVAVEGQPLIHELAKQPALFVEEISEAGVVTKTTTLAHRTDVQALGEDLATAVSKHVDRALKARDRRLEEEQARFNALFGEAA